MNQDLVISVPHSPLRPFFTHSREWDEREGEREGRGVVNVSAAVTMISGRIAFLVCLWEGECILQKQGMDAPCPSWPP